MDAFRFLVCGLVFVTGLQCFPAGVTLDDDHPLTLPTAGSYQLRVLSPTMLELTLVTSKEPSLTRTPSWDFVDERGNCRLPAPTDFKVLSGTNSISVKAVGFKRRVLYAPLKHHDLRVGNYLYLELNGPIVERDQIHVENPNHKLWAAPADFSVRADRYRFSPAIHVNQTGYLPAFPKRAMVGYYLGNLGELDYAAGNGSRPSGPGEAPLTTYSLVDAQSNHEVFQGELKLRPDRGYNFPCYQKVLEADFSAFKTPGEYRLFIPGLGASYPFRIDEGTAAAFARAYALGIYHQRCGTSNTAPFTRFVHGPCHTAGAAVPDMSSKFAFVNDCLAKMSADYKENPRHTAPQLKNVAASLYPFVNRGPIDVSGGHHDAGDYSKYTINSAGFIHHLVFAADAFPGVNALDNLGLPESGDGKSDILQEAKWEADFLAKMQDADGGFYFLVYPRDREYEDNVTPDHGDPQVVFPKTTAVTAAATAALAQCASSPTFKKQFPEAAALYFKKAQKGWAFLERALAKYGKDGSYQKITHYGNEFMHDDELAWAACEMYLATGQTNYHAKLLEWLNPADPGTRRWGWQRLYDSYGCAIRSYAFAARTGRLKRDQLNQPLLEACENEIVADGEDQLQWARECAYGSSFPDPGKKALSAGWYFSMDAAFDLAVACQLDYPQLRDPRPKMIDALLSNLNYEEGCNPVNVTYLTGLGWKRQREIVHQYALNDRRVLPPSGIPLGNIQAGVSWNFVYNNELEPLSFPSDGSQDTPFPFYDRWADAFNLSQEFVILNQARALGCLAWLMAQTSLKDQPWKPTPAQIAGLGAKPAGKNPITVALSVPGLDLSSARIVWEAAGQEPALGQTMTFNHPDKLDWVEAEAQLPDGRRVFGIWNTPEAKN